MIAKKLRELTDERAVSPVIGVILMVAITVILAAVIGTFVLGLGGQVSQTAPQASITITDASGGESGNITIAHDGGDSFNTSDITVYQNGTKVGNLSDVKSGNMQPAEEIEFNKTVKDTNSEIKLVHTPSGQLLAQAKLDIE